MTTDEVLARNRRLTDWTVRLDNILDTLVTAHSDTHQITVAFNQLTRVREEMDRYTQHWPEEDHHDLAR